MKSLFRVVAGLAALASVALSGTAAGAQNWTGFYVGASAGGGTSKADLSFSPEGTFANQTGHGALGGIQTGFNVQSGSVLVGIEADYMFTRIKGQTGCPNAALTCDHDVTGLGSARGRLGWVAMPTAMLYFTAGLGRGSTKWRAVNLVTGVADGNGGATSSNTGLVLGGGAEFSVSNNWSIKTEYLHYNLGSATPSSVDFGSKFVLDTKLRADTFKLGLNYKF
jgi:outer membrane immunogenic protein